MTTVSNGEKQRVFVAEDHPLMRDALRELIARQADMEWCGEADCAVTVRSGVARLQPHLVLMDLRLKSGDGLELIKCLLAEQENLPILVISQCDEAEFAERALRAGARGYLMKEQAAEEVLTAIRTVLAGEVYMSRRVAAQLFYRMSGTTAARKQTDPSRVPLRARVDVSILTDRELQVFQMLGTGKSSAGIAKELNLSIKTVETHREHLKYKLGIGGAPELVRVARDWLEQSL